MSAILSRLVGDADSELFDALADLDGNRAVELRDAQLLIQQLNDS